jgi:hypothetical protein
VSKTEIANVVVSKDGDEIEFTMQDDSTRTIKQPFSIFRAPDPLSFCMVGLAAALLHAYDRIAVLESKLSVADHPEAS